MKIIDKIKKEYLLNFEHAKPNLVFVGLLGLFGFPTYYFVWNNVFPQQYENLYLRIFCSFLFLPFVFYSRLPDKIRNLFPHYFFFTLFFTLSFFFSFMLIKNNFSAVWTMSFLAAIFLLVFLIYNWILIISMILVAFAAASGVVFLLDGWLSFDNFDPQYIPIYLFVMVSGVICNYRIEISNRSKVKAMQAFGGSVAHEMRNPLNAINLLLMEAEEVFKKQKSDIKAGDMEKVNQLFSTMSSCTTRANSIIDLILSNIRNGKVDNLASEILPANELLSQAIKEYGYNNPEERKKVKLELSEDFTFRGERTAFIYILFNLIKNALYYLETYPNSIVTIKTIKANQEPYNKIIVRDTGPGISQERIKSLFKAFNTSGKKGGTGLGLDFVYKTMKSFKGNVECNSKLGEFTEFVLSLPICHETIKKVLAENPQNIISDFKGKKILLIDDEMLNRKLVRRVLEGFNLQVFEGSNGQEALKVLKETKGIDLIFTDINMPIMDGYEFTKSVRSGAEFANYKNTPIVAFTGNDDEDTLNKIHTIGINNHLRKGFGRNVLTNLLNKILN